MSNNKMCIDRNHLILKYLFIIIINKRTNKFMIYKQSINNQVRSGCTGIKMRYVYS